MNRWFSLIVLLFLSWNIGFGQSTDQKLAIYYHDHDQCEKALPYFEKVYKNIHSDYIYQKYRSCLLQKGSSREVIRLMKQQIQYFPHEVKYGVSLGKYYKDIGDEKKMEKLFDELIEGLPPRPSKIIRLQKAFSAIKENNWALKTLKKGDRLMGNNYPFNVQYAAVYGDMGETEKMIQEYIDLLDYNPRMLSSLKRVLPRMIDFTDKNSARFQAFRRILIQRIQKHPNNYTYSKLFIWALEQGQNFPMALIQAKSLSRRTKDGGAAVYKVGLKATQNKDYLTAQKAFQYIIDLGEKSPYYSASQEQHLNVGYLELKKDRDYSEEKVNRLIKEYRLVLSKLPKNGETFSIIHQLAEIQAYYGNRPDSAIQLLTSALKYPQYNGRGHANLKILLGDITLLTGNIWDASLLYMQVVENYKYERLGQLAKFKNARIYYYSGDFKYAQSQLDVLKQATSKLIANNAMNLSAFITENLGIDSNYTAMRLFAKADLLVEQHQYKKAITIYDSIAQKAPNPKLTDNILMRKAKISKAQRKWKEAVGFLETIVKQYSQGILADDALYQMAKIYQDHLNKPQKAKEYYLTLMRDYSGSVFVTGARKRFRAIE